MIESELPLLDDLRAIGIPLKSIWSGTMHIETMPEQAFRIIMHHLRLDYDGKTREGMARKLARKEARDFVWDDVLDIYPTERDEPGGRVQEGLGSAIHVMARRSDLDVLIDLIRNPANGGSRLFFVRNLARTKSVRAFDTLYELRHDPELKLEIGRVLKRRKAQLLLTRPTWH
jgi:hypothetical protein